MAQFDIAKALKTIGSETRDKFLNEYINSSNDPINTLLNLKESGIDVSSLAGIGSNPPNGILDQGFGWLGKDNNFKNILGGLQTIGGLWSAYQGNKLAKRQLRDQRDAYNINLENRTRDYNRRINSHGQMNASRQGYEQGTSEFDKAAQEYVDRNKLELRRI